MAHLLLLSLPQCHHASCLAAAAHCSATRRHARATSSSPSSFSRVAIISYRRGHHDPTGGRQYQTSLTSFWSQLGQFEWNVVPFSLQGSSSLLMRVMNQAPTVALDFEGGTANTPRSGASYSAQTCHRSMLGFQWRHNHWAGVLFSIWTTAWRISLPCCSTCSSLRRCLRSSVMSSSIPRAPSASLGSSCRSSASWATDSQRNACPWTHARCRPCSLSPL